MAMKILSDGEIGDLLLSPDGEILRITIAAHQDQTTLTRAGAQAVIDYLQAWIVLSTPGIRREEDC